jgi:t-SNARE domain-containing protein 1
LFIYHHFNLKRLKTIDSTNKLGTITNGYFKSLSLKRLEKDQNLLIERSKRTYKDEFQAYGQLAKEISEKLKLNSLNQLNSSTLDNSNLITFEENEQENDRRQLIKKQKQQDLETRFEFVQERDQRVRQIESEILDINVIMKDMASIVNDQSSIIDNIDTNIESTYSNVENGNDQLFQATKYASRYRKKILILIFIALAVCVALGLIIYFSIKK